MTTSIRNRLPVIGESFGDRTVVSSESRMSTSRIRMWLVRCKCGTEDWVPVSRLVNREADQCKVCGIKTRTSAQKAVRSVTKIDGKERLGQPRADIRRSMLAAAGGKKTQRDLVDWLRRKGTPQTLADIGMRFSVELHHARGMAALAVLEGLAVHHPHEMKTESSPEVRERWSAAPGSEESAA